MMEILWEASEGEAAIRNLRSVHPQRITFRDSLTPKS
jgi:hypothetical protein